MINWKIKLENNNTEIINNEFGVIYLITGKDKKKKPHYCYVFISSDKIEKFVEVIKSVKDFYPDNFGEILLYDYGSPKPIDTEMLKEKFASVIDLKETIEEIKVIMDNNSNEGLYI